MSAFVVTSTYLLNSCRTNPFHSSETFLIHVNRGGIVGLGVNVVFIIDRAYISVYFSSHCKTIFNKIKCYENFCMVTVGGSYMFLIPKLSWSTKMALTSAGDMTP